MKKLFTLLLSLLCASVYGQVSLTGTSYSQDFDAIGSGLPTGWTVRSGATATTLGTAATFSSSHANWNATAGQFANFASGDIGTGASTATQAAATDRSLGVRQTGSFGDPGASFNLQITNTTGLQSLQLSFKLQSLDAASPRTTTWRVQYGLGATPTTFTDITTGTTGGAMFANATINVALPQAVENQSGNVWIRIVTIANSGGSGNRPTSGIDDFSLTYVSDPNAPNITATPTSLSGFATPLGTPSAEQSYTVSAVNLTNDLVITAPTNFEIATAVAGPYGASLNLSPTSGTVASTLVYVRLTGATGGVFNNQNLVNASTGATSRNVVVSGTVNDGNLCGTATNIATVRAGIPAQNSFTGTAGTTIAGTVTGIFGNNKFYVQDATGGIAVFFTNVVPTNGLALGDQVRMTGTPVRFNGEAQLNTLTCIAKISGGTVPSPIVFDANNPPSGQSLNVFLAANEGALVRIISGNILSGGTFAASTNYIVSTCNNQGGTEIRIDANSSGIVGSAIPTVTQDITGVVGRFITSNGGTDKLQMFPRSLSDFSNSTTTCTISGGCGVTTFPNDANKLDVVNWNIEWLGHPSNGPSQSGANDATQIANAQAILNGMGAEVYMLQEITDYDNTNPTNTSTAFGKLIQGLNTTFGAGTYTGECSPAVSGSVPEANPQRVCIIYKTSAVTKVFSRPMFANFTPATYVTPTPSQFWASGRKPFMFMGRISINSQIDTVLFVGLHAKAGSSVEDWNRRKFDVKAMYDTLQAQYPSRKTIILGDMNDDFDVSIYASNISSYAPFLYANPNETMVNGTRPNANWEAITKPLSDANCSSTISFPDYIDHQIVSNEMLTSDPTLGFKYVSGSASSVRPTTINYGNTTSDHYITAARFEYAGPPCPTLLTLASPADDYATGTVLKQAKSTGGKVVATNQITGTANVTYQAASVELNPGFQAANGTVFLAQTGGCN